MGPISFLLILSTTAILRVRAEVDTRACYDSSNNIAELHRPCLSPGTQQVSHCCSLDDTCLGDTLCLSQFATLYVGTCTIRDWADGANGKGACPKYCDKEGRDIGLCNNVDGGWEFCCGVLDKGSEDCCAGERFKLGGNVTSEFAVQRPWEVDALSSIPTSTSIPSQCPLLIALGLLFWENKKRRLAEARLQLPPGSFSTGPGQHTPPIEDKHGAYANVRVHDVDGLEHPGNELASDRPLYELAYEGRQRA